MRRFIFILFMLVCAATISCAQVIECNPEFPSWKSNNIVITFNADKGSGGLKGFTGDVYAHTGVILKGSTDWTHIKNNWTVNKPDCKLTRLNTNTYTLNIGSIKDYYNITDDEAQNVDKLVFVFRSADGSREGKDVGNKDIFLQLSDGLNFKINTPTQNPFFVDANQEVTINFSVSDNTALIKCNDSLITGNTFTYTAVENGVKSLTFTAESNGEKVSTSLTIVVRGDAENATMPINLHRGVNKTDDKSATFLLFAPNKKSVYVTGDFNNWSITNQSKMKKDGDYFFCTITNLDPDKEYGYQYIVDENIKIADPYTEKILDPQNDKYIPSTIYPNLSYPQSGADGIVSTFTLNKKKYNWKNTSFKTVDANNLIIYELLIRDFTTEGSIKAVTNKLDYIQQLGINAIELLPFSEFEGNDSWGYNPSFYFAADKAYGTQNDYKAFIDECHGRGIAVIQDIVLNHSFLQSPFVQLYFNKSTSKVTPENPWYNVESPNKVYSWGYDFNHESTETKLLVDSVLSYWITEYNVDGFRFDFTKGFTNKPASNDSECSAYDPSRIAILKRIYDKIKSLKSDAVMICEHLTDNTEEKELANYGILLWGNMNYSFCQSTMGYKDGASIDWALASNRGFSKNNLVVYAESHDEERMMFKALAYGNANGNYSVKDFNTAVNRMKGAAAMLLSIPGPKMIWQFGELGYEYSINYDLNSKKNDESYRTAKKPVPSFFENQHDDTYIIRKSLYDFYAFMDSLKINSEIMQKGTVNANVANLFKTVTRSYNDNCLIFATNFDVASYQATIDFPKDGLWYNIIGGTSVDVINKSAKVKFNAGETMIFSNNPNDIRTDISTPIADVALPQIELNIYPNPANNFCRIYSKTPLNQIYLYTSNGTLINKITNINNHQVDLNVSGLASGVYIVVINVGNQFVNRKIFVQGF